MKTLTLHLDGTSPDQLPMSRLAEYLRELSILLGSKENVHFQGVSEGSACLNTLVDDDKYEAVLQQAQLVAGGGGAKRAQQAYRKLVQLMGEDQVDGALTNGSAKLLAFPKARSVAPPTVVRKTSSVQGRLYLVGGKGELVPVRLEGAAGETLTCEVSTTLAEKLGSLLFKHVRLHGEGVWESRPNGGWRLKQLDVHSFDVLESSTFRSGIGRLRALGSGSLGELDDAHRMILESRG